MYGGVYVPTLHLLFVAYVLDRCRNVLGPSAGAAEGAAPINGVCMGAV